MTMFRRKEVVEIDGAVCPYCEFVNPNGTETCAQCYYQLGKAPRDQGEEVSAEFSSSIFDELTSDEDDSWEEGNALDVVLEIDEDPLAVEQYAVTDFSSDEPENIGFMDSKAPSLSQTIVHEEVEVEAVDIGSLPSQVQKMEFDQVDPLSKVEEPVHVGGGQLFTTDSHKMDDDLLGHVGGKELPSLPTDNAFQSKVNLNVAKVEPAPQVKLPELPTIEEEVQTPAPEIVQNGRFWPWPEMDSMDPRDVHRQVVRALECAKATRLDEAAQVIDELGPHLCNDNVDLIYHVGMILKQLGRFEDVKSMLATAKAVMPDNEHVSSAVAYLRV
jgi:hypothetical protein